MHIVQENWELTCVCTQVLLKAMKFEFTYSAIKLGCHLILAILSVQKNHSTYQPAGHKRITSLLVEIVLNGADLWIDRGGKLKWAEYTQVSF